MQNLKFLKLIVIFISFISILLAKTNIIIVHSNDTHGRLIENNKSIGMAKIATYINNLRKDNAYVLYLDAGDTTHGTEILNLNNGSPVIEIFNYLKLDAMSPGNHDFNYGISTLLKNTKKANFNVLAANVVDQDNKNLFTPSVIKKINNEVTVGIIGLTTPETSYKTHPKNVENVKFTNIYNAASQEVAKLKLAGANFIIVVGHLGIDTATLKDERSTILATVPGIDLIVDGHSHTKLLNGLIVNNITIAQTGEYTENLGYIDVEIDGNKKITKAKLLEKDFFANMPEDKQILKIIDKYQKKQNKYLNKKVTTINFTLNGSRELVRSTQTNLGFLIATAIKEDLNTDIGLMNGGGIRSSINAGDVLVRDIVTAVPFGNTTLAIEVTGKQILELLEFSVANTPNPFGGYLQISGISFEINTKMPANKRIDKVLVNNKSLELNKIYTIATLDFLAVGGDGYTMLKNSKIIRSSDALDQIVTRYLTNNKNITAEALKNNIVEIK